MRTRSKKFKSSETSVKTLTPFEVLNPVLLMVVLTFLDETEWVKNYTCLYQISHACRGNILQTKLMMQDIICLADDHHDLLPAVFFLKHCAAPRLLMLQLATNDDRAVGREGLFIDGLLMQLAAGGFPLLQKLYLAGVSVGRDGAKAFADAVAAGYLVHLRELGFVTVWFGPQAKECKWVVEALLQQSAHLPNLFMLAWAGMDAAAIDLLLQVLGRGACAGVTKLFLDACDFNERRVERLCEMLTSGKSIHRCALSLQELWLRDVPGWKSYHSTFLLNALADTKFAPTLKRMHIGVVYRSEIEYMYECVAARRARLGTSCCFEEVLYLYLNEPAT